MASGNAIMAGRVHFREAAMTDTTPNQDPMEFLKGFWGNMGFPLPGMVTPTVNTDELGKRITDLKAVEGWLKTNLSMLQMTIQGLEMQRATLATLQTMGQHASNGEANANPFLNFMPAAAQPAATEKQEQQGSAADTEAGSAGKRQPKG
jgi:hypothetical protein